MATVMGGGRGCEPRCLDSRLRGNDVWGGGVRVGVLALGVGAFGCEEVGEDLAAGFAEDAGDYF